jgi:hypothetical protein
MNAGGSRISSYRETHIVKKVHQGGKQTRVAECGCGLNCNDGHHLGIFPNSELASSGLFLTMPAKSRSTASPRTAPAPLIGIDKLLI